MAILSYNFAIQFGFFWRGGNMGNKQKVTITVDEAILKEIDKLSKSHGESRSRLIEDAIQFWREKELEKELIDGYQAMAKEDAELAENHLEAGREVLK
jgi:metal-responsive CopG/Arc/MetJ family transcriptional regulator